MLRSFVLTVALVASTLAIASSPPQALAAEDEVYPLVFPIVGRVYYSDTFGACRDGCSRSHIGNDLMTYGLKGLPVVAAHDGVIRHTSTALGRACCAIWGITADDGWETWYIHMNNDTPGTDDGRGWGFAPGIEPGVRVQAGQLIGWVGDSGNAERVAPQIHFELRRPDGTPISPYASLQAATPVDLPRLAGQDRFLTAAAIALDGFPTGSDTVFVATGWAFPDALAVGTAGAALRYPVVLTDPNSLPGATRDVLDVLEPSRIVVVGGPAAVSDNVVTQLAAYGEVERIGGENRYQTATLVAEAMFTAPSTVYIANGYTYPQSLSAAVVAGVRSGPLVLTDATTLPGTTRRYLEGLSGVSVVAVGDVSSLDQGILDEIARLPSVDSVERISGDGDVATSIAVSQATFPSGAAKVYLATALEFADALAGAALAGTEAAPVLLLDSASLDLVDSEVQRLGATEVIVLGGPAAVGYDWILPFWNRSVGNTMPVWNSGG